MNDEIGIELLKDLAGDIVAVAKKYSESKSDDGKVSKVEIIAMLPKAAAVVKDLGNFSELISEIKDIDSVERKQLFDHIVTLDIIGDKAEIILVNVLEIVEAELAIYKNNVIPIIDVFKKD